MCTVQCHVHLCIHSRPPLGVSAFETPPQRTCPKPESLMPQTLTTSWAHVVLEVVALGRETLKTIEAPLFPTLNPYKAP